MSSRSAPRAIELATGPRGIVLEAPTESVQRRRCIGLGALSWLPPRCAASSKRDERAQHSRVRKGNPKRPSLLPPSRELLRSTCRQEVTSGTMRCREAQRGVDGNICSDVVGVATRGRGPRIGELPPRVRSRQACCALVTGDPTHGSSSVLDRRCKRACRDSWTIASSGAPAAPRAGQGSKRAGGCYATGPRERGVSIKLPGCCAARKARHLLMELTCAVGSSPTAVSKIALGV